MAITSPFGLIPDEILSGASDLHVHTYFIPAADTNLYRLYDPVKLTNTASTEGVASCILAGSNDALLGSIIGMSLTSPYSNTALQATALPLQLPWPLPATTKQQGYYVLVADDPGQIFRIADDGNASWAAGNVNNTCSLTIGATVQATSTTSLLYSSASTTNTLNIKIMGLAPIQNNQFGGGGVWRCKINNHVYGNIVAGI